MADKETNNWSLDEAKLDVLMAVIHKAIIDFEYALPTQEDVKQYMKETVLCESWKDFDTMVEELAIDVGQELSIKKHLASGQLHGKQ